MFAAARSAPRYSRSRATGIRPECAARNAEVAKCFWPTSHNKLDVERTPRIQRASGSWPELTPKGLHLLFAQLDLDLLFRGIPFQCCRSSGGRYFRFGHACTRLDSATLSLR